MITREGFGTSGAGERRPLGSLRLLVTAPRLLSRGLCGVSLQIWRRKEARLPFLSTTTQSLII